MRALMTKKSRIVMGVLFIVSVTPAYPVLAQGQFQQGVCGQTITESVTLTQDIGPCSGPGIVVGADGITIDGDGYKIIGPGAGSGGDLMLNGVVLVAKNNVTIKHLFVEGFDNGIAIDGGEGNIICTNRLDENGVGVFLSSDSSNTTIRRNIIADNAVGIYAGSSGNNIFHNLIINNNDQIEDVGGNTWQDPEQNLGNYWGNYWGNDTDGDFVGDTRLPHEGVDSYPLLDPMKWGGGYLCGDWWLGSVSLVWRGGWSPVDIQVTDPLGQIVSAYGNQIGKDAFYVEVETESGSKLVQVLVGLCTKNPFEGIYSFQMTETSGQADLSYWMTHFASQQGDILLQHSIENGVLAAGETQQVRTAVEETDEGDLVVQLIVDQAPGAEAGPDQTVEQDSHAGASVTLDGSGSSDPDGDPLTYSWTWDGGTASGVSPTIVLPLGSTAITLVVNDGTVDSEPDTVDITVEDTTPPTINNISADPSILWPPNHKMVQVTVIVDFEDICDPAPFCYILGVDGVDSSEPINGPGDGNTEPDWEITGDLTVDLRAKRAGGGNGRIYTIHVVCEDASGNIAPAMVDVTVPHDQGKGKK